MKAIVFHEYGPPEVLKLQEVPKPVPKDDEILVAVRAASVSIGDCRMRKPDPFAARLYNGLLRPRRVTILGFELAGQVEATGKAARRFREGDPVFSFTGFHFGAYAEYRCLPETGTVRQALVEMKPAGLSFEEAAAIPSGGLTALAFLRKARVQDGSRVLVYGASGSVGTYAVQLARYFGAQVTGVCSGANMDLVRSLGAEKVIDYTRQDFTEGGERYDFIFDAVGKSSPAHSRHALARGGVFLSAMGSAEVLRDDLAYLKKIIEQGKLKAVIDRTYSLEQIVEAHRYVEAGHKRGNVVIRIGGGEDDPPAGARLRISTEGKYLQEAAE